MVTLLLIVVAVLVAAGMTFMVVQALRGCCISTVWVCCGSFGVALEFLAGLVGEILNGVKG